MLISRDAEHSTFSIFTMEEKGSHEQSSQDLEQGSGRGKIKDAPGKCGELYWTLPNATVRSSPVIA